MNNKKGKCELFWSIYIIINSNKYIFMSNNMNLVDYIKVKIKPKTLAIQEFAVLSHKY